MTSSIQFSVVKSSKWCVTWPLSTNQSSRTRTRQSVPSEPMILLCYIKQIHRRNSLATRNSLTISYFLVIQLIIWPASTLQHLKGNSFSSRFTLSDEKYAILVHYKEEWTPNGDEEGWYVCYIYKTWVSEEGLRRDSPPMFPDIVDFL